ncbi:MAG: DEAD/DEAH box helicase [Candidatus Humimicrobiaceae bacterium]
MVYEERRYQVECEDALLTDVLENNDCHPVAAVPTGGGKTKILSSFIYKYLELRPTHKILVVSHTEDILLQDHAAIGNFFPGIKIGLYSAGLDSRTVEKITVAGIQSIYKKSAKLFKDFDLCIVDECHSVPTKGNGMYQQFFQKTNMIRVGLSATIFRTGHGYIYKGKGALFNKLSYDLCNMENFNKLVKDGYLSELYSKPAELQLDTKGVKTSAGDFSLKDMSSKFDRDSITEKAVIETVKFGKNYKSWLIFAIDIEHADNINNRLIQLGIKSEVLHSKTKNSRHDITSRFKKGETRCIVSVGMLQVGFDAPNIDLIVLLRPTKSPVLHVQMIGRGLRVCLWSGKTHCLILDFAGNVDRLGPVNNVTVPTPGKKKGKGKPITKMCLNCGCLHHPSVKVCNACNYEFIFTEKIKTTHGREEVVQKQKEIWMSVTDVHYKIHRKNGSPNSLKVTYLCGIRSITEYVCYDHTNWKVKNKANHWVNMRWNRPDEKPMNVQNLFYKCFMLSYPEKILVDTTYKYPHILDIEF